jgi:hypothetical protein
MYSIIANHTDPSGAAALHVTSGNAAVLDRTLWAGNDLDSNFGQARAGSISDSNATRAASAQFVSAGSPRYDYHILGTSSAKDRAAGSGIDVDIDGESRALFGTPDVGADEYAPVVLSASPVASGSVLLSWATNTDLVAGLDHFDVVFSAEPGANPPNQGSSPINAGTQATILLTGLSNGKQYTFSVDARSATGALIASSNAVSVFPLDKFVYLPTLLR